MNNLDRANNEVINRIHPLPSDQLGAGRDGNHWFSLWPWMFCGSCLQTANYVHQYRRALLSQWQPSKGRRGREGKKEGRKQGACLCPGVISEDVICPDLELMGICVSRLGMTTVCLHNMHCIWEMWEKQTDSAGDANHYSHITKLKHRCGNLKVPHVTTAGRDSINLRLAIK